MISKNRQDMYDELHNLAKAVLEVSKELTSKYFALCDFIISCQFSPKEVTKQLLSVGMDKRRISEVKMVCFTSREIYAEFKLRLAGWKPLLRRISGVKLTDEERLVRRWQQVFNQVEKLDLPKELPIHEGNGRGVLMWMARDFVTSKTYKSYHYRVTVEKILHRTATTTGGARPARAVPFPASVA